MTIWRILETFSIPETKDASDTSGGWGFHLGHAETGEERDIAVLLARGPSKATYKDARKAAERYLDLADPPGRIKLDRQGNEI